MAQAIEIRVPNIGDFSDVPVLDVLVHVGDTIAAEDPLITLESEKATMDVPSPQAGVVQSIAVKSGDKVSEGSPIVTLAPAANGATPAANGAASAPPATPAPPVESSRDNLESHAVQLQEKAPPDALPLAPQQASDDRHDAVHASPSIRRFARELGVDIAEVRGSGPQGRITREDVQSHVKDALATPRAQPGSTGASLGLAPWPHVDFAKFGPVEHVPLSRIRKLSGPNLHRNWVMIPHVTNNDEADVTELEAFRKSLNAEQPQAKVTLLAFVLKALVAALRAFPEVNSSLDGDALVLKKYYNVGFAADTPGGLMVPVIKGVDGKGILEIAAETAALAGQARDGKLAASDMQGATFTVSSLGGIGGTSFTPIINAPEVAILGLSRTALRPVWNGTTFIPRLMLPLSLSYDHRVIDGALAARFNAHLTTLLTDLRRTLL